jgi:hypothetical protein
MKDALPTYLHDHLAGAQFAVELLETIAKEHAADALGAFASGLLREIQADRRVLEGLAEKVGGSASTLKTAAAWLGERAARWKLRHDQHDPFGMFEAAETLCLGVLGKKSLWAALKAASPRDGRLLGPDYDGLQERADTQYRDLENWRIQLASTALSPTAL